MRQKVLDARWVKKNVIGHYKHKNILHNNATHGFNLREAFTPARLIPQLLDPENSDDFVCADSGYGYAGARFEYLLAVTGFESQIHEKGSRCHPLNEDAKERNKVRSSVRADVELA